jgi:hypothetical protein
MFAVALVAVSLFPVAQVARHKTHGALTFLVFFELIVPPLLVLFWIRRTIVGRRELKRAMAYFWLACLWLWVLLVVIVPGIILGGIR